MRTLPFWRLVKAIFFGYPRRGRRQGKKRRAS